MKFTLKALQNAGACAEGRTAFTRTFGKKGAEARDVFTALTENGKRDWLIWIVNHFPDFLEAVGEINVNGFQISFSGQVEASGGIVVFSSGSATVEAYGSATVIAYDSATVRAYDNATVEAYGSATVRAYDSATVRAYDSATVRAYGSATVRAYDSATVEAYDNATVEAYGSATVEAYGSATITIPEYYSSHVEITILSPKACAVDRRSGKPELILATESEVSND